MKNLLENVLIHKGRAIVVLINFYNCSASLNNTTGRVTAAPQILFYLKEITWYFRKTLMLLCWDKIVLLWSNRNQVILLSVLQQATEHTLFRSSFLYRWGKRAAHNRAQIVYYMAENLELRHSELSQRLCGMTGCSIQEANKEVDVTIQRLIYWGAYADKYGGTVQASLIFIARGD